MYGKDFLGLILISFIFLIITFFIFDIDMSSKTSLSASEHIQELIHKYPIVIFSKSSCPYCRKAKNILSKYKLDNKYYVLELNKLSNTNEYQTELQKLTGDRTVPENLEKQSGLKHFNNE
jgi:glutaredoxin